MTHKQRVLNAIKGTKIDFLPSHIKFSSPKVAAKHARYLGVEPEGLERTLDNHMVLTFTLDQVFWYRLNPKVLNFAQQKGFVRIDEENNIAYDRWGVGWDIQSEGSMIRYHPLSGAESLKEYSFPDPHSLHLLDMAEQTLKKEDEHLVVCTGYWNLFERAWALCSFDKLMMDLLCNRRFVEELFDRIADYQVEVAKRIVDLGVSCAHTGGDFGTQRGPIISPDLWRQVVKPRLKRIWGVYKDAGIPVIHHSCGDVTPIILDMIEIGLDVLEPVQPLAMSLEELAREFGKDLAFFGGIDTQRVLPYGAPAEVREFTKFCIETLGKNGKYIIAPSQDIISDVPVENFKTMVDAIKKYR